MHDDRGRKRFMLRVPEESAQKIEMRTLQLDMTFTEYAARLIAYDLGVPYDEFMPEGVRARRYTRRPVPVGKEGRILRRCKYKIK